MAISVVCISRPALSSGQFSERRSTTRSCAGSASKTSACSSGSERLQNGYGVVALQIAHALDERLDRKFLQNILAGRFADLGERGEIEVRTHQLDQLGPRFVIEQLQQRADIGFVQRAYEVVRARGVAAGDGLFDARHEIRARLAGLVAKNLGAGLQFFTIEGHIGIRLPSAWVHNPLQPELKT